MLSFFATAVSLDLNNIIDDNYHNTVIQMSIRDLVSAVRTEFELLAVFSTRYLSELSRNWKGDTVFEILLESVISCMARYTGSVVKVVGAK